MTVVILSRTVESGDALESAANFLLDVGFGPYQPGMLPHPVVRRIGARGFTDAAQTTADRPVSLAAAFRSLCATLDPLVTDSAAVEVWVDEVDLSRLNPLDTAESVRWEVLVASAMLVYPDVRWRVGFPRGAAACTEEGAEASQEFDRVAAHLSVSEVRDDSICGLFDGDGLRDWIRGRMARATLVAEVENSPRPVEYLPRRTLAAVALDEETAYSYFHAYVAYRFGFRATAIISHAAADSRLKAGTRCAFPKLVFEDVYLKFPDSPIGMSDLEKRSKEWGGVEQARWRVVVTAGQQLTLDPERRRLNHEYLERQKKTQVVREVYKPSAGMWDLRRTAGMACCVRDAGFVALPNATAGELEAHDHSCPGMLLLIAETLMARAEKLLPDVRSVEDAVCGAVMATDALELLGGRTPTAYVEALRLKHHFETLAECQFSGVEYHFELDGRLTELAAYAQIVSKWFLPAKQADAAANAELYALGSLLKVYRDHDQFDEEQKCLDRVRSLHHALWLRQLPYPELAWPIVSPFLWYCRQLLSSIPRFCAGLCFWLVFFTCAFTYTAKHDTIWRGAADAVSSFFSVGPPIHPESPQTVTPTPSATEPPKLPSESEGKERLSKPAVQDPVKDWPFVGVACFSIVCGFFHVGVFIAHLYSVMRRK